MAATWLIEYQNILAGTLLFEWHNYSGGHAVFRITKYSCGHVVVRIKKYCSGRVAVRITKDYGGQVAARKTNYSVGHGVVRGTTNSPSGSTVLGDDVCQLSNSKIRLRMRTVVAQYIPSRAICWRMRCSLATAAGLYRHLGIVLENDRAVVVKKEDCQGVHLAGDAAGGRYGGQRLLLLLLLLQGEDAEDRGVVSGGLGLQIGGENFHISDKRRDQAI